MSSGNKLSKKIFFKPWKRFFMIWTELTDSKQKNSWEIDHLLCQEILCQAMSCACHSWETQNQNLIQNAFMIWLCKWKFFFKTAKKKTLNFNNLRASPDSPTLLAGYIDQTFESVYNALLQEKFYLEENNVLKWA